MVFWRANIGLVCPGPSPTVETDFHRYAPKGVGISTMHIPWAVKGGDPTPENLLAMVKGLEEGCKGFYDPRIHQDVIIFGCTSGSLIGGPNFDKECIKVIEDTTGTKGLTTSTAILMAVDVLNTDRLAVFTPYPDATNEAEKVFLEKNGVAVTTIKGINPQNKYIPAVDPKDIYQEIKKIDLKDANGIFISCTGLDCTEIIPLLEVDYGLPVITSDQASLWASLRAARVGDRILKLGKLCTEF